MLRWIACFLIVLAPLSAFAEVSIDVPIPGADVATPFLVEGRAPPGTLLELIIDERVVLVFRATAQGTFRIPVDIATNGFTVRAARDHAEAASIAVNTNGAATPRASRTETAKVEAAKPAESVAPLEAPTQSAVEPEQPEIAETERTDVAPEATSDAALPSHHAMAPVEPADPESTAAVMELSARPTDTLDDIVPRIVPEPQPEPPAPRVEAPDSDLASVRDVVPDIVPTLGSEENRLAVAKQAKGRRPWKRWHVPTLLTQVPAGVVAGLSGAYLGVNLGYYVVDPIFDYRGAGTIIVPTALLFTAATGIAVWAVGKAWGGKSPWWASMLGATAGSALSFVSPALFLGLPSAASTVAYHLAAHD